MSFLSDSIVVFNVKGNRYRLEVQVVYKTGILVVRWIGTHAGVHEAHELRVMAIEPKIIKTEQQYRAYLAEVERLASLRTRRYVRPTVIASNCSLSWSKTTKRSASSSNAPTQSKQSYSGWKSRGCVSSYPAPILGGKNRVSEVLSRKRPLTLSMVRALSDALHIPTDLLIREPAAPYGEQEMADVPLSLLVKSGWFTPTEAAGLTAADIVQRYLKPQAGPPYLRHTITYGATQETNKTNLRLWVGRVRELGQVDSARTRNLETRNAGPVVPDLCGSTELGRNRPGPRTALPGREGYRLGSLAGSTKDQARRCRNARR